jgi:PAS domain S-box-containing protein
MLFDLFDALMANDTIGVAIFDRRHRYVRLNGRFAQINGLPVVAHVGRTLDEVAPGRTATLASCIEDVFVTGKSTGNVEVIDEAPDDPATRRHWLVSLFPIHAPEQPDLVGVILTAASARVQAQITLRGVPDRFQTTFDKATVGMAHVSLDGQWLEVNQHLCELFGYSREALLKTTIQALTHPENLKGIVERLQRMASGEIAGFAREKRFIRSDGKSLWGLVAASLVLGRESGQPRYFIIVMQDITLRKELEERLSLLAGVGTLLTAMLNIEEALQAVSSMIVPSFADWCAVELVTEQGDIEQLAVAHVDPAKVAWAEQFRRRFRAGRDSLNGVPHVIRTGESEFYQHITDEMLVRAAKSEEHLQVMREIGFSSAILVPLRARGNTLGAVTFVYAESKRTYTQADVHFAEELANYAALAIDNARLYDEARRTEAELRVLNETLEQRVASRTEDLARSNRDLQDFAYVASHDLQEPLRKIVAFSDRLQDLGGQSLEPVARDYLARMQNAAARMQGLINDLLTLSHISTRGLQLAPTNLAKIIHDEVLVDLEASLDESHGTVEVGDMPHLIADPLQMRQLMQNLIGNGLKFRRAGVPPRIRISSEPLKDATTGALRYRIIVEDNGIGFDNKYADRIFQPFQRLHGNQQYDGTGMGLAICRKIAERHGGTIAAQSRIGQGTTFVVTLPVLHPTEEPPARV